MPRYPLVIVTGAVALTSCVAHAQPIGSQFRLDLSLVARTGDPETGIADVTGPAVISNTQSIRIELRYRIADLAANDVASRGLGTTHVNFRSNRTVAAGSVRRSTLTNAQLNPGSFTPTNSGVLNPDNSGQSDLENTGTPEPFRAWGSDQSPGNGGEPRPGSGLPFNNTLRIDGNGFTINPFVLAPPMHLSWLGTTSTNIGPANTNTNPAVWALYSFDYVPSPNYVGSITFSADAIADPQTGNKFSFFTRTGTLNNAVPVSDGTFASTPGAITITVVPAPAATTPLALLALAVMRRRR